MISVEGEVVQIEEPVTQSFQQLRHFRATNEAMNSLHCSKTAKTKKAQNDFIEHIFLFNNGINLINF